MELIDKSTLVTELERRKKKNLLNEGAFEEDIDIISLINTLEVKEIQEETESIWHDANELPTMYRKYLVRYSNGRVSGSWERHDDGFIPWKDVVKEHKFTHWCYTEDLLKL